MSDLIKITLAESTDARGVQEVFYRTWLATYPNKKHGITADDIEFQFKDAFTEDAIRARGEKISRRSEENRFFVAKEGERVIGLCGTVISEKENRIRAIYVLPEYQKKGIGRMLWDEAYKVFTPDGDILVDVAEYNANAISFYGKLGFVDTGKRWSDEKFRMKSGAIIPEMEMIIRR